jgi:hypothetical protein
VIFLQQQKKINFLQLLPCAAQPAEIIKGERARERARREASLWPKIFSLKIQSKSAVGGMKNDKKCKF